MGREDTAKRNTRSPAGRMVSGQSCALLAGGSRDAAVVEALRYISEDHGFETR
jgi:hypothetical protein